MYSLNNEIFTLKISDGFIKEFYNKDDGVNLAGSNFGCVEYTLISDDITKQENVPPFSPYMERMCRYTKITSNKDSVNCYDEKNRITTKYELAHDGLNITSETDNSDISQFALNLDLNFLGKKGTSYNNQLLPTSPYTSVDGQYMYCIMTSPNGSYLVATAAIPCVGWKIKYSPYSFGHYILSFQFISDFDKAYLSTNNKKIKINIQTANTLEEAYKIAGDVYGVPYCTNISGGTFGGSATVKLSKGTDKLEVKAPSGKTAYLEAKDKSILNLELSEYGVHIVTPISKEKRGMNTTVWNGGDIRQLFNKSCDSVKKPYHPDNNLCEGGCFLWAMLSNMNIFNHHKYNDVAKKELDDIIGCNGVRIERRSIIEKQEKFNAYHIYNSDRVQEQFFGISILLEAYKVYKNDEYLNIAIASLLELIKNYITNDGMIWNGSDYTTVCAPIIPIVDMSNFLKSQNDTRSEIFEECALKIADFLIKRGYSFPTEGEVNEYTEPEMEDGSISCTALSLLYVCFNLRFDEKYLMTAKDILKLHDAWTIYTPDARMYQSSFRWWETIWEGDGEGPAICAGHAWTIWRAEALFYLGILTMDEERLLDSWNGFITNFSKTTKDGTMYACYEPDYIRGGGLMGVKQGLAQLNGEDLSIKRVLAHDYPKHADNSLSRYAWVRAAYTWLNTAAIITKEDVLIGLNAKNIDEAWHVDDNVNCIFLSDIKNQITIKCKGTIKFIAKHKINVIKGYNDYCHNHSTYVTSCDGEIIVSN